jgi:hypothetical protein
MCLALAMEQVCCFCGLVVERNDQTALALRLSNLWKGSARRPEQQLAAHTGCFAERVASAFAAGLPFDAEALAD